MIDLFLVDLPEIFAETVSMWLLFIFNHKEWEKRYIKIYDFTNCSGGASDTSKHSFEVDNEKTSI
jgi:hypothetical protein